MSFRSRKDLERLSYRSLFFSSPAGWAARKNTTKCVWLAVAFGSTFTAAKNRGMKKLSLALSFSLTALGASAQPVLDKLFDFAAGDEYVFQKLATGQSFDTTGIPTVGTNLTWNFSTLQLNPTVYRDTVIAPSQSVFPASFPTATYVFKEHSGLQQYYRKRNDTIMYLGSNYGGVPTVLNPGGITVILPATHAASGNNNFGVTPTQIPGGATWTYWGRYNAFGSLQFPGGVTVQNVGLYIVTGGQSGLRYTDYIWAQPGKKDPVMRIQWRHQGGVTTIEHLYVSVASLTGIVEGLATASNQLKIFPNPATDVVQVQSDMAIRGLELFDATGRLLRKSQTISMDVKGLAGALYLLKATTKESGHRVGWLHVKE